jgi:protein-S-isoprenylcysteine O-methyltransferase Ste14
VTTFLVIMAVFPASASVYFPIFWLGLPFWRRHIGLTYLLMVSVVGGATIATIGYRDGLRAHELDLPLAIRVLGGAVIAASFVLAMVADRQIGIRVRSFLPFFEEQGRIRLVTTGAYGVVRHPIYAGGIYYQIGVFLVTGNLAALVACAVLSVGAAWFTRREERGLVGLLDDPREYEAYRARVPALLPFPRGRSNP